MGMCAGKTECEIYRNKKYCSKFEEKSDVYGVCACRHALHQCEVGSCVLYLRGCNGPSHVGARPLRPIGAEAIREMILNNAANSKKGDKHK